MIGFGVLAACLFAGPVPDVSLVGPDGASVRLSAATAGRPSVVVFVATGCPLADRYAGRLAELSREFGPQGMSVLLIAPNGSDGPAGVTAFVARHELPFPVFRDPGAVAVAAFGAERSPEAFVLNANHYIRYRGRIDDQYRPGMKARTAPGRADLATAAREVLAGRPVAVPRTPVTGCRLDAATSPSDTGVTYTRDVARIVWDHCAGCHRPGQAAPFPLLTYRNVKGWAGTIAEVLEQDRMPPWGADPKHGSFRNAPRLAAADRKRVIDWIAAGCPEGSPADLPPQPAFPADAWAIPGPDVVFALPEPEAIPAAGVVDYRYVEVDPGFAEDMWVAAAEVRPGNRRVLHHCNVYLRPPGVTGNRMVPAGPLGSFLLAVYTPGTPPQFYPAGTAKRIPAGWRLLFELHYTSTGTPETDRTSIGLVCRKAGDVITEAATQLVVAEDLDIPPGAADHRVERQWTADREYTLLALFPHMHLRGKSFRYTAEYPGGTSEILLDVPRYDPNWQHRYELAEPKRLPAGTVVRSLAVYDNSAANGFNPDPAARVRTGPQVWDEMFNGYLDVAVPVAELTAGSAPRRWGLAGLAAGGLGLAGMLVRLRRK